MRIQSEHLLQTSAMVAILLSLLVISTYNIIGQTVKYSNEFMSIGVGARALGMSNSAVSITDDVSSGYWNPAGLQRCNTDIQFTFMHSEYFAGIAKYDYGSIAARIDATSVAGISFIRFGVDDIPDTSELIDSEGNVHYDKIKSFSAADYAMLFSYSKKLRLPKFLRIHISEGGKLSKELKLVPRSEDSEAGKNPNKNQLPLNNSVEYLNFGANVKIIHRIAGDFASSWGFGLDLGLQYDYKSWMFGIMLKDITTTYNSWSYTFNDKMLEVFSLTGNNIPKYSEETTLPKIILGTGRKIKLYNNFSSLIALDIDVTTDGKRNVLIKGDPFSIDPHLGVEFAFKDIIFLRGGLGNIQQESDITGKKFTTFQPNAGIGIKIKNLIGIDYALTDIGNSSVALYSNIFSLKLYFDKKGKKH